METLTERVARPAPGVSVTRDRGRYRASGGLTMATQRR